jgi:hypothetical protein
VRGGWSIGVPVGRDRVGDLKLFVPIANMLLVAVRDRAAEVSYLRRSEAVSSRRPRHWL